jgi:hypothetical protein
VLVLGGAALSGSRTVWLAVGFILFAAWGWRGLWCKKGTEWGILVLALFFVSAVVLLRSVAAPGVETLLVDEVGRAVHDSRLAAWTLLGAAALDAPWWGYGIGQVAKAHILLSTEFPGLGVVFAQSHNLFLDLVLWLGLPIGIVVSGGLVVWLIRQAMQVTSREQAVMILFLVVMANHSMLEYPLYYAYFLLPAGAVVGVFSRSLSQSGDAGAIGKSAFAILAVFVTGMFFVIVLDYLKVENSYRLLRMEWMGFILEASPQPPDVIALDQWEQAILMARVEPRVGMDESSIANLERVAFQAHKPIDFRNMAHALLLNGRSAEAALWIERLCRLAKEEHCVMALKEFESRNVD